MREWELCVPEIVPLAVSSPYRRTEIWHTDVRRLTTLDYRLLDIQHSVLSTRLPLDRFYQEPVRMQAVLHRQYIVLTALRKTVSLAAVLALRGQTNFLRMLWRFGRV